MYLQVLESFSCFESLRELTAIICKNNTLVQKFLSLFWPWTKGAELEVKEEDE